MNRFTKKTKNGYKSTCNYLSENPFVRARVLDEAWDRERNKLGQLEDIEDELGIDLITLHKCFKSTKFYVKSLFNEIIEVKSDIVRFDIGNGYVYFGADYCPLSSYGKTWALTKEELIKY